MEENKKKVYAIILDCWNSVKKHGFQRMTDDTWDQFIDETNKLSDKWKSEGRVYWDVYRKIMAILIDYVEYLQKTQKGE